MRVIDQPQSVHPVQRTYHMIASGTGQDPLSRSVPLQLPNLSAAMRRRTIPFPEPRNGDRPILGTNPSILLPPGKLFLGILEIPETDLGVFPRGREHGLRRGMRCPCGIEYWCGMTTDERDEVGEFGGEWYIARGSGRCVEGGRSREDGECAAARDLPVDSEEFLPRGQLL